MTYITEMYTATMSLPPSVWMALGMSLVAASAVHLGYLAIREAEKR